METELKKSLTPMQVWSLALGCIIGWGAFVMPGNTFLPLGGPVGTAIAMVIASIVMIIIAVNYCYMIKKYPSAGGEFTYTQRVFGRRHAFICSWYLGLSYLAIVPLNATALALVGHNIMNNVFQWGFKYSVVGYEIYLGELILACSVLVVLAYLCTCGVKITGKIQNVLVVILITSVFILTVAAIINPNVHMRGLIPYYGYEQNRIGGILAIVAIAPWAFVGFDTIPQSTEEFNFSTKKTMWIMVFAIVFGASVYAALNTVTALVIPEGYSTWGEYISESSKLSGLLAMPTFNAAHFLLGRWGLIIICFAVLSAILSGIIGFYMATSRLLFALSREKYLPRWFSKLHKTYKTPSNAIIFVMIVSILGSLWGRTALGWIVDMSSIGAAIGYGYTSCAALKTSISEKNIFVSITGVLGAIFSIAFIMLLLVPMPMAACSLGKEAYVCLVIWTLLGVAFYVKETRHCNWFGI